MKTFHDFIQDEKPVLVDFFATWCGPCQTLSPILQQLKESLGDEIHILKIDVDKNELIAARYQVRNVPTLILFQKGNQLWRQSGVLSKDEIRAVISQKTAKVTAN